MDERYDRLICPLVDAGLFRAGVIANQGVPYLTWQWVGIAPSLTEERSVPICRPMFTNPAHLEIGDVAHGYVGDGFQAATCMISRLFVHVESPPLEISEH
jgi:hypothetical protein